ncbi:MAG: hypothetical protein IJ557_02280 [Bacteroidaceae bacterium]|nr:hypothetical protein [Bacteroidaceae bacterium]
MRKLQQVWTRPCLDMGEGDVFTVGNVVCAALAVCVFLVILGVAGSMEF